MNDNMSQPNLQQNLAKRVINFIGDVNEDTVKEAIEKIIAINMNDLEYADSVSKAVSSLGFDIDYNQIKVPPIILNLSTFGGDAYSAMGLCDVIRTSDTPIHIICSGKIMSAGIPIMLSGSVISAHKNTTFMIHDLSGVIYGTAEKMAEDVNETNRLRQVYYDYIITHSKFPKKKLNEIFKLKQDYYFGVEEAQKYKMIDNIIE